jgi:hypothetical protein
MIDSRKRARRAEKAERANTAPEREAAPLRDRPADLAFAAFFAFAAWSSWFSDIVPALGMTIAENSPSRLGRLAYFYAKDADPLLIASPYYLRISCFISAFVFGSFYPVLVYGLVTGKDWIRMPAIVYASAMTYGMVMFLGFEFFGPLPPTNLGWFALWNLPYLVVPLLLAYRMWEPDPFRPRT